MGEGSYTYRQRKKARDGKGLTQFAGGSAGHGVLKVERNKCMYVIAPGSQVRVSGRGIR